MNSVGFQNLRSLKNTGQIDIKPITILVGKNSSGKSTFLRTFPLIKQSVEARTTGPILWYGRFIDFGSFNEAIFNKANEKEIVFKFEFSTDSPNTSRRFFYFYNNNELNQKWIVNLYVSSDQNKNESKINKIYLSIGDNKITINFDRNRVKSIDINGSDFSSLAPNFIVLQSDTLIPNLIEEKRITDKRYMRRSAIVEEDNGLFMLIKEMLPNSVGPSTITDIINMFKIGESIGLLEKLQGYESPSRVWNRKIAEWTLDNEEFIKIKNTFISTIITELLETADTYIQSFYKNSYYIAPIRATAERYYRLQDLAVDEVDFQGINLAMFLRNLSPVQYAEFQEWTKENFGFIIKLSTSEGHISIKLKNLSTNEETNLADTGFGYSQVLPIITQLWFLCNERKSKDTSKSKKTPITFTVEQPELHLHPSLQATLVDAFISAINVAKNNDIDLNIIIETHSETIINRFGHNIYKRRDGIKRFSKEDITIVIFEKSTNQQYTKLSFGQFDELGFLQNWPSGFFEPGGVR